MLTQCIISVSAENLEAVKDALIKAVGADGVVEIAVSAVVKNERISEVVEVARAVGVSAIMTMAL